jgi:ubiquinone/menaquinone biosynthesis C-methylase UbiE
VVIDWKQRAVEQWTADPCGSAPADDELESRGAFERIVARKDEQTPWLERILRYRDATGLDVLDVGCGQGIDLYRYAAAGARATGIDLTPRHVALARAHLRAMGVQAEVIIGDAERMPFPDDSFDWVSSNGVLHHTPDIRQALAEIRRVLRPGGRATIIVYNRTSVHFWLYQILWRGIRHGGLLTKGYRRLLADIEVGAGEPLVRVYSPRQVRRMLTRAGFRDVSSWVCPLLPTDSPFTKWVRRKNLPLGWYVVGRGSA